MATSPYHEGEREVQTRVGSTALADRLATAIVDTIPAGARAFLAKQTMLVAASVDRVGDPWVSVLFGAEGFVSTADGRSVRVTLPRQLSPPYDAFWKNAKIDAPIGLLAIELATRRRLRVNGQVSARERAALVILVRESYANCPKYIQRRIVQGTADAPAGSPPAITRGTRLSDSVRSMLHKADTFFVGTRHPAYGADVSHRGGRPGFIDIRDDVTLRIPDYAGNNMFNTLGNLVAYGRAGLYVPDFDSNRAVQLSGSTRVLFDEADPADRSGGTERFWEFIVDQWIESPMVGAPTWELVDYSPFNPVPPFAGR